MKTIEIKAISRDQFGKKSSNSLRAESNVPCVMYKEEGNLHFYAHENVFRGLIYTPEVYLVSLIVEGKSYSAVMKDMQFHPVTDRLLHIDFMQVFEDKPVTIDIPLKITGESVGVKAGGKLRVRRRTLKVKGLTKYLPDHITIDITPIGIGESIKIGDISHENLEIIDNSRAMIISVDVSRISLKDEEVAAPEAEAAAEETPAAEKE